MRERVSVGARVAAAFLILLAVIALAAPLVAPYDPAAQPDVVAGRLQPPSAEHPFGTDTFSRDVLSRVIYGARVSLAVGVLATALSITLGIAYGMLAGMAGGRVDTIMMRILDGLMAIPRVLLMLVLVGVTGSLPLAALVLVLGLTGWFQVARLVRAETLVATRLEYMLAARALGAGGMRLAVKHLLPNVTGPAFVAAILGFAHVIVLEAGLSYLGLGVQPPTPSWGNIMLEGSEMLRTGWWIALFPGLVLSATVLAVNAIAEQLRLRDTSRGLST